MKATKLKAANSLDTPELEFLLNNISGYAMCILDEQGRVYNWNKDAQKLTGYKAGEIIGKPYAEFFTKGDVRRGVPLKILSTAAKNGSCETEGIRVRKDGTFYWANGSMTAIRDKRNRLRGFARIMHDASKKREIDRQKDEFIGIAAHELRTPITTLSLYAQLLAEKFKRGVDKATREMMDDIKNETDRLTHIVDDLLTMNSVQAGTLVLNEGEFDAADLAKHVIKSLLGFTKAHRFILRDNLKRLVVGDQDRVRQVLLNILENAIKYAPKGKIIVTIAPQKGRALISVQDSGPGIKKSDYRKIFESRYRAHDQKKVKAKGLGLGLYISARVIRAHGQRLWVESELGKGSTFYFTLPLASTPS